MGQKTSNPDFGNGIEWDAVGRYLAGESSADEAAAVGRALEADPSAAALVSMLQMSGGRVGAGVPVDVETALSRVHARLDERASLPLASRRRNLFLMAGSRMPAFGIAAALTLMIGGALLWRSVRSPVEGPPAAAALHYETGIGVRDSISLADGSLAVLGPASSLDVDGGYGAKERAVSVRGEGYFVVKHDARHPFVVRAGATTIRDVGTAFTVRNAVGVVRVAVFEGIFAVRSKGLADEVELRAGDASTSDTIGRVIVQRNAVVESDTAWKRGQLVFTDAAMHEVRDGVRRWYGVELRIDSTLARRHVTATFQGEPVAHVLEVIALTLGARVQHKGDIARLRAGANGSP